MNHASGIFAINRESSRVSQDRGRLGVDDESRADVVVFRHHHADANDANDQENGYPQAADKQDFLHRDPFLDCTVARFGRVSGDFRNGKRR